MTYYLAENGQTGGPYTVEQLLEHGLTVNSMVWNDTLTGWTRAGDVAELQPLFVSTSSYNPLEQQPSEPQPPRFDPQPEPPQQQQPEPQQPEPQYAQPQYQQPQYQQPQYQQPHRVTMPPDTSKTLAIVTLVASLMCCCNVVSAILAIASLTKGSGALAAYDRGDSLAAASMAKTARTLALIGFLLLIVWPFVSLPFLPNFDDVWSLMHTFQ